MSRPSPWEREAARVTSEVARRAIRRLDVLEWVILVVAAGLAVGGGFLVAVIISGTSGPAFRATWIGASLLLLIIPGAIAFPRVKREERQRDAEASGMGKGNDG